MRNRKLIFCIGPSSEGRFGCRWRIGSLLAQRPDAQSRVEESSISIDSYVLGHNMNIFCTPTI
jgi:hypothetical protein